MKVEDAVYPRRKSAGLFGAAGAVAVLAGGVVAACGPSYQAIYEGDARFEHCYALDDNAAAPMRDKKDCWRDWTRRYSYGQTRDRMEYASSRARALSRADLAPTDEALMEAAPGAQMRDNLNAPAPTNAFAPPPKTLEEGQQASNPAAQKNLTAKDASAPEPALVPPTADCEARCKGDWNACKSQCDDRSCDGCDRIYRKCMGLCFRDKPGARADAGKS